MTMDCWMSARVSPSAEPFAESAVAAVDAEAGDDEVAESAQSVEGLLLSAESGAEADHFGERAGDEGGFGVVAEPESVGDTGGDGVDVFQGAAEFHAGDVVARVGAEGGGVEKLLQVNGEVVAIGGQHGGGGRAAGHFLGVVRSGEGADGIVREKFPEHLCHKTPGVVLETFGTADERDAGADAGLGELLGDAFEKLGRGDDNEEVGAGGRGHIGGGADVGREGDAGEEKFVGLAGVDFVRLGRLVCPDGDGQAAGGEELGQRAAPTAGADDGDGLRVFHFWRSMRGSVPSRKR